MRNCKNCVFHSRVNKNDWCMKLGNLCRVMVGSVDMGSCNEHQYPEKVFKPILDEAVNLMDSFLVTLSNNYERRAKKVIQKFDELFQVKAKG